MHTHDSFIVKASTKVRSRVQIERLYQHYSLFLMVNGTSSGYNYVYIQLHKLQWTRSFLYYQGTIFSVLFFSSLYNGTPL